MCPGSKLGYIMTITMGILALMGAVIADISSWGRHFKCDNDTFDGETDFCDANFHDRKLLLTSAILQLANGAWTLAIIIIATAWFSFRYKKNTFPTGISSNRAYVAAPQFYGRQQQYGQPQPIQSSRFASQNSVGYYKHR